MGLDFWKMFKGEEITLVKKHEPIKKHVPKPVSKPTPKPESKPTPKPVSKPALKAQNAKGNSMLISCPMCKKTFGKPMVMLDFSSGKAKLVNTCPYCNKILGETDESEEKKEFETRVLSPDEKTDAEKQRWR